MVAENEWDEAYRDVIARGRTRVGDPPAPETLIAYSRGELTQEDAERVREALAYYPELARALSDDAESFDETRESIRPPAASTSNVHPARYAFAAAMALLFLVTGIDLRDRSTIAALKNAPRLPHVGERVSVYDDTSRSDTGFTPAPVHLHPSTRTVTLTLNLVGQHAQRDFRVELVDLKTNKVVWESVIPRGEDGTFTIEIPRELLQSGAYRANLYADSITDPIATYRLPGVAS